MKPVHECSSDELLAEAQRRADNRRLGRPLDYVAPDVRTPEQLEADRERDEKRVVRDADKQLLALGFRMINTSQARAAKVTPGIPDRLYFHRGRRLALWWEAKTADGEQSPAQKDFQDDCDACGWPYVLGTDQDLFDWLVARRVAVRGADGLLVSVPYLSPSSHIAT